MSGAPWLAHIASAQGHVAVDHSSGYDPIPIEYNSMILYPSFYWHSAYVESEWFNDSDRITLTGFMGIDPNHMNFKKENLKNVYSVWEFFGLNKIYGLNQ